MSGYNERVTYRVQITKETEDNFNERKTKEKWQAEIKSRWDEKIFDSISHNGAIAGVHSHTLEHLTNRILSLLYSSLTSCTILSSWFLSAPEKVVNFFSPLIETNVGTAVTLFSTTTGVIS